MGRMDLTGSDTGGGSGGGDFFGAIGTAVGGIASGLGSVAASHINAQSQAAANAANIQSAREQMGFQERMSNTAYQRSMADMKAAGLNPMLAFQQGGASTPSGASGNSSGATVENPISPAITAAVQMANAKSTIDVQRTQAQKNAQDAVTSAAQARSLDMQTKIAGKDLPAAEAKAAIGNWLLQKSKGLTEMTGKAQDHLKNIYPGKSIFNYSEPRKIRQP